MAMTEQSRKAVHLYLDYILNEIEQNKSTGEFGFRVIAKDGGVRGSHLNNDEKLDLDAMVKRLTTEGYFSE